nr:MAG TPA: major capsid protein [Bacteriophage sp.]
MAGFTKQQLENLKLEPENLASIKDAVQETFYNDEDYSSFVNIQKVKEKDPIALLGEMEMVGKKGGGCDPTYEEKGIANSQKRWELGQWEIPIKICYEALKGSIAEYSLKTGTAIGDLTSTDFMTIYTDALQRAMQQMIWRFGWFGDKAAALAGAGGGKLTAGSDVSMFNVCDGLFKRIFTATAAKNHTTIAANSEATTAAQVSALRKKGAATTLVDTILMDVDTRIIDDSDAVLLMTRSLADALTYDIKQTYHDIMPWEKVFDGFDVATYNGVKIARVGIWDRMIKAYEKGEATINLPHRAVFCNPKHLMIGTDADNLISDLDIWFDKKERRNYLYATGKIGTALLEEDMIHAAY